MTGTAVNPALRAAYLAAKGYAEVTLMLPWLADVAEQEKLFGSQRTFASRREQEAFVYDWVAANAPAGSTDFALGWYPARYAGGLGSILSLDDITSHIPARLNDVVILEEPEHLNWYRNGPRWTTRFAHVVGVAHTNYEAYASTAVDPSRGPGGKAAKQGHNNKNQNQNHHHRVAVNNLGSALVERVFTETVTRAHCDVVLQLSSTLRPLPHSRVCNVHGVRETFLAAGDAKHDRPAPSALPPPPVIATAPCYFLGKALWAKGYDQLLLLLNTPDLLADAREKCTPPAPSLEEEPPLLGTGAAAAAAAEKFFKKNALAAKSYFRVGAAESGNATDAAALEMTALIDCYGNGPDLEAIQAKAASLGAPLSFKGAADHANVDVFGQYDVFVNPSISEVLCTATAEALAMGKYVVISRHPSNEFFYGFERCHTFAPGDGVEFREELLRALALSAEERATAAKRRGELALMEAERVALSWQAATDRLVAASALDARAPPARLALASLVMHSYHWSMTRSPLALDLWLTLSGAGPHKPWEQRYPQAFRALNASNARADELKKAARALRVASEAVSQRIRNADQRAITLARYEDSLRAASNKGPGAAAAAAAGSAGSDAVSSAQKQQDKQKKADPFRVVAPKWLAAPPKASHTTPPAVAPRSLRRAFTRPLIRAVGFARKRRPRLPRNLAERTARATADFRSSVAERAVEITTSVVTPVDDDDDDDDDDDTKDPTLVAP